MTDATAMPVGGLVILAGPRGDAVHPSATDLMPVPRLSKPGYGPALGLAGLRRYAGAILRCTRWAGYGQRTCAGASTPVPEESR